MDFFDALREPLISESGFSIPVYVLPLAVIVLLFGLFLYAPITFGNFIALLVFLWPAWAPPLLGFIAWHVWVYYKNVEFLAKQNYTLLEIKVPREIKKSPLAMEAVLSGLHIKPGEGNWYFKYIKGQLRPWFSLEMMSKEGDIHFYIWTRKNFKNLIETNFYAQYPEIQLVEVDDYSLPQSSDPEQFGIWGSQFNLTKDDAYPIKTYIDYGLDKDPKEELRVDPFSNLLEFLGSLKTGQQVWVQIMIQVTKKKWRDEGKETKKKIIEDYYKEVGFDAKEKTTPPPLPKDIQEVVLAIDRNTSKLAFDTGIRGLYIAREGHFNPVYIAGLTSMFKQFSSENLNGFKPTGGMTKFDDYPWEDIGGRAKAKMRRNLLEAYKRRSFFNPPFQEKPFVLSVEELASIFHPPSSTIRTPTLERIQSATAEAPSNLPV